MAKNLDRINLALQSSAMNANFFPESVPNPTEMAFEIDETDGSPSFRMSKQQATQQNNMQN